MDSEKWLIDNTHSEIRFRVRHMMVSYVTGFFNKFNATVETKGGDFTTGKVHFTADIDSISTNNEQRDAHLKSGDFFDVEKYPQITFESDRVEKVDDEHYKLQGTLTMRGVSKPITLDVEYGGAIQDTWGNTRAGFHIEGKINRREYGINFSQVTETGGIVVGDEVKLSCDVEFLKQQKAEQKDRAAA